MTPKTHRVHRPEAAGSRHSPLHMRETKLDSEIDQLERLQLPEGRDCIFSREEEAGRGKEARSVTRETACGSVAPTLVRGES